MEKETAERNIDRKNIKWGFFLHEIFKGLHYTLGIAFFSMFFIDMCLIYIKICTLLYIFYYINWRYIEKNEITIKH